MAEGNPEDNLRLKRVLPFLDEPLQSDSRGCLRVFAPLFDNFHASFREHNVAMRVPDVAGNPECVHHASLVAPLGRLPIHVHKVDTVFHPYLFRLKPHYINGAFEGQTDSRCADEEN
jgi:hypothetical protein